MSGKSSLQVPGYVIRPLSHIALVVLGFVVLKAITPWFGISPEGSLQHLVLAYLGIMAVFPAVFFLDRALRRVLRTPTTLRDEDASRIGGELLVAEAFTVLALALAYFAVASTLGIEWGLLAPWLEGIAPHSIVSSPWFTWADRLLYLALSILTFAFALRRWRGIATAWPRSPPPSPHAWRNASSTGFPAS